MFSVFLVELFVVKKKKQIGEYLENHVFAQFCLFTLTRSNI